MPWHSPRVWVSPLNAVPATGVDLAIAHPAKALPLKVTASLVCLASEWGWNPGDEVDLATTNQTDTAFANIGIGWNASTVFVTTYQPLGVWRRNANGPASITPANWAIKLIVWV